MGRLGEDFGFQTAVDETLRSVLARVDTAFMATVDRDGQPYVQHRGGAKGFVRALDEHTVGFVDFAGNRQYISVGNLEVNDRVCLFLIDYARRQRVKLWGRARIAPATTGLLAQLMPQGYRARPERVVLIEIVAWDVNCPAHIPQKLDAADVAAAIDKLEARIATLEAENAALRALGAGG